MNENEILKQFIRFLDQSPTVWHAAKQITNLLAEADFTPLEESERWDLEPGKGYFVVRDEAAVCAFRIPKKTVQKTVVLASHIDSPALKLKPAADLLQQKISQLATEPYGAPMLHSWLDRDLALAGRVITLDERDRQQSHIVWLDHVPMIIPQLPLHLDRTVNEKGLIVNKQDHLKPVVSIQNPATVESLLKKSLSFKKLVFFDLLLVPLQRAAFTGAEGELISSYRLDNLTSAYACLYGLLHSNATADTLQLAVFWDHEEIGSKSFLGAESFFVNQAIERICLQQKIDREDYFRMKSRSYCVSADLCHGFNPNYPDRFDPQNAPLLGSGVVVKTNAQQKYATNAATAAPIVSIAAKKNWPLQTFAGRSDVPSGSTVGSIMGAVLGFPTVDIGISGWAMHSIRETISARDEIALCEMMKAVNLCT